MLIIIMLTWLPWDSLLRSLRTFIGAPQLRLSAGSSSLLARYLRRAPPTIDTTMSLIVTSLSSAARIAFSSSSSMIRASVTRVLLTA